MKKTIYTIFLMLLLINCMDDKGNYHYINLDDATVNYPNSESSFSVIFGNDIQITPIVKTEIPENDLEFTWQIYDSYQSRVFQDIYTGKNLDYKFNKSDYAPFPNTYSMRLKVTQISKGVSYYSEIFKLSATAGSTGLMVLHGNETECDVAMVVADQFLSNVSEGTKAPLRYTVPDFYSQSNGSKIQGKGVQVFQSITDYTRPEYYSVYIVTDRDVIQCDFVAMQEKGDFNSLFLNPPSFNQPRFTSNTCDLFLVNDERLYHKYTQLHYGGEPFIYPLLDFKVSRYIGFADYITVVFNAEERNFVTFYTTYNQDPNSVNVKKFNTTNPNILDVANINADLLYMDSGGRANTNVVALFKDDNGDLFFGEFNFFEGDDNKVAVAKYNTVNLVNFSDRKFLSYSTASVRKCYYATSSNIYRFTLEESNVSPDSEPLTDINGNFVEIEGEITMFKILKQQNADGNSSTATSSYAYRNKMMIVGTYDGTQGKLYAFELDESGFVISKAEFSGFDKIFDANIKGL